jgi:hypothetical protein
MDSTGNDVFRGHQTTSLLSGDGFSNRANGFANVFGFATNGDAGGVGDQAFLNDSAGNDLFRSFPTFSVMNGDQFNNHVSGFDRVFANAINGDAGGTGDRALMYDSAGNDFFHGYATHSVMLGVGFYNRALGFDQVYGYATSGDAGGAGDQAFLNDSAGNDIFRARSTFSVLTGDNFYYRVSSFDRVIANALNGDAGGVGDQAFLQGSAGNDVFYSTPSFSYLRGDGFYNHSNGFDQVFADALTGDMGGVGDRALLFDSPGDDLFYGRSNFGTLSGVGFRNRATNFDSVVADGNAGGVDTLDVDAIMYSLMHDGWEEII